MQSTVVRGSFCGLPSGLSSGPSSGPSEALSSCPRLPWPCHCDCATFACTGGVLGARVQSTSGHFRRLVFFVLLFILSYSQPRGIHLHHNCAANQQAIKPRFQLLPTRKEHIMLGQGTALARRGLALWQSSCWKARLAPTNSFCLWRCICPRCAIIWRSACRTACLLKGVA